MQSLTLSAQSDGIGFAPTKRPNQGFTNTMKSLNETTAETLKSASFKKEIPLSLFGCLSKLAKLLTIAFISLFLIGCGNKNNGSNCDDLSKAIDSSDNTPIYRVSFYDANFDLNGSISVKADKPKLNPTQAKTCLGINNALYSASSAIDVSSKTSYDITGDANFYAIANVKEITNQTELVAIDANATSLSGAYILLSDIALKENGAGFEGALGWKPIGDRSTKDANSSFTGVFNGNGHKITGLWINRPAIDYIGLFGYIENAKIINLGVEIAKGKSVKGRNYIGGIAGGIDDNSSIINSYATGNVSGTSEVGGIAGIVFVGSITNSYATGNVSGTSFYAGGIAGTVFNDSEITNSYATGDVSGDMDVGGIVGFVSDGSITNSYVTGNVSGDMGVGGIVGSVGGGSITNSYATGDVSGDMGVGGIVGGVSNGSIQNNAAINPSVSGRYDVNRIVGRVIEAATISDNLALNAMKINAEGDNANAGTPKTNAKLKTQSIYENLGWSFGNDDENPWKIDKGKSYPYLYWERR
ncbi:MAG: hypothetical protein LBO72_08840 [Helicobacteraceae bacterium]|jgi:hypothetical protein|nr:hypothetical protein [Helicobacteraceae bacterium]